jgi:hypothetical protein
MLVSNTMAIYHGILTLEKVGTTVNDQFFNTGQKYHSILTIEKGGTTVNYQGIFIKLAPGVNVIKLFSSLQKMRPNKLECLWLAITLQSSLTFGGNTRSLPKKEASERSSNWVCSGLALKF